ncbi:MAG: MFS transporter [Syntrophaceae bacterium]|nr:MFS transporter [Syntrophaceae bacterium]
MKTAALIVALLSNALVPFLSASINIALPAIAKEFQASALVQGWIPTAFLLTAAVCSVPFGRIADIYGMKKNFSYGILLITVASLFGAFCPSAYWLILFRVLQGIGAGIVFVTSLAIVTSIYRPEERGKAIGMVVGATYASLSLAPVLGGAMTHYLGWRSLFWSVIPIGITILLLVYRKLHGEWAASRGETFDLRGAALYSIAIVLIMFGFSQLPKLPGAALILLGIAVLAGFVRFEAGAETPLLNVRLFQNKTFALSNLAALLNYSAVFMMAFIFSLYLQYIRGFDPHAAGMILVIQPIVQTIFAPIAGRLSDKIHAQKLASLGMALSALGLLSFAFLSAETPLYRIVGGFILMGIGFALFATPNMNAIMGAVERRFYGIASAMVTTMRLIGQMFSMGLVLMVFSILIGGTQITPATYPALQSSISIAFSIGTALCVIGTFISLARGK